MAKPNIQSDDPILNHESPLARAEAEKYVEQQKEANFNQKIGDYMFWGATSIVLGVIGAAMTPAIVATLGLPLLIGGGATASLATFVGSLFFSRKATDISERSNVLYSDIDSQNQARRMVQSFARAQSQAQDTSVSTDETPFTAASRKAEWVSRTGVQQGTNTSSWQSRIAAQADLEDAQALSALRS